VASVALAVAIAGCGGGDSNNNNGGSTGVWVQTDIAGVDIDGDGRTDIVTIAMLQQSFGVSDGYLKIYRQTTPGVFVTSQITVGKYPWRVRIADVNGDGAPDILVLDVVGGSGANDDVLYLILQNPNARGTFQAPRAIATGLAANDFLVTDVNLDNAPDILTAGIPGGGAGVAQYLQRLTDRGTFDAPTTLGIAGFPSVLGVGDIGLTGRRDLVAYSILDRSVAANSPGQLVVAYSTLLAGVGSQAYYLTPGKVMMSQVGLNPQRAEVVAVDRDGRNDAVVCFTPISTAFKARISTAMQRVLGQFTVVDSDISALKGIDTCVVADLNGDGRPDVATTGFYPDGSPSVVKSRVNILAPTNAGAYAPTQAIDMPVAMSRIGAADVDGDGLIDLLLLGDSNRAYVMLQSSSNKGTFFPPRLL
jgi:hypothetical protein